MELDTHLFALQDKMIAYKPKDYRGDDFSWELNVIYWMAMAREKLLNGSITMGVIEGVANNISK
jgi:hypothetical protein